MGCGHATLYHVHVVLGTSSYYSDVLVSISIALSCLVNKNKFRPAYHIGDVDESYWNGKSLDVTPITKH
jgi:hypothetical protein